MATQPATVTSAQSATDDLAEAIRKISRAADALVRSGINRKGIVILLSAETQLPRTTVGHVLDGLENLERQYTRPVGKKSSGT